MIEKIMLNPLYNQSVIYDNNLTLYECYGALQTKLNDTIEQVNINITNIQKNHIEIDKLKERATSLEFRMGGAEDRLNSAEFRLNGIDIQIEQVNSDLQLIHTQISNHQMQLIDLNQKVEDMGKTVTETVERVDHMLQDITNTNAEVKLLNEQISQALIEVNEAVAKSLAFDEKVNNLSENVDRLQQTVEDGIYTINKCIQDIRSFEERLGIFDERINEVERITSDFERNTIPEFNDRFKENEDIINNQIAEFNDRFKENEDIINNQIAENQKLIDNLSNYSENLTELESRVEDLEITTSDLRQNYFFSLRTGLQQYLTTIRTSSSSTNIAGVNINRYGFTNIPTNGFQCVDLTVKITGSVIYKEVKSNNVTAFITARCPFFYSPTISGYVNNHFSSLCKVETHVMTADTASNLIASNAVPYRIGFVRNTTSNEAELRINFNDFEETSPYTNSICWASFSDIQIFIRPLTLTALA